MRTTQLLPTRGTAPETPPREERVRRLRRLLLFLLGGDLHFGVDQVVEAGDLELRSWGEVEPAARDQPQPAVPRT